MKLNSKGFSLVELMIAMAICTVILGATTIFMSNAQKSYRVAEETIDLQKESQILMEQLSGWVMEANHIEQDGNLTILYSIPRNNGRTDSWFAAGGGYTADRTASKRVIWMYNNNLYMKTTTGITDASADSTAINMSTDSIDDNLIAEYVTLFDVNYDVSKPNQFSVSIGMKEGSQTYQLDNDFMMLNE